MGGDGPYFSIIMPMYNRAKFVGRALASCLSQSFADFEVVVVDDGSDDGSYDVVLGYRDSRVRPYRHEQNRGVCPARNTAIDHSRGTWLICLDTDDELLPGALEVMHERTRLVGAAVGNVRFMCRFDSGEISPDPPFNADVLDYEGYIKWLERASFGRHEAIICLRRSALTHVRFPDSRANEKLFHFEFSKQFLTKDCPEIVRLYHQDADNSLCATFSASTLLSSAPDQALLQETLLQKHGDALRRYAPNLFRMELRAASSLYFLAGRRTKGLRYALAYLRIKPYAPELLVVIPFGLCGRSAMVLLKWLRAELWLRAESRRPQARMYDA